MHDLINSMILMYYMILINYVSLDVILAIQDVSFLKKHKEVLGWNVMFI